MGGWGGSAVGAVALLGVCWCPRSEELGTRYSFSSSKIKPKNRELLYTEYIRRCSLVLSASSAASFLLLVLVLLLLVLFASAEAASAAAAAAAATALRTAGWSCSVFFFSSNSLAKATW